MHIDKAKKRIAKQVKKGFSGYPSVTLAYFGATPESAQELVISFTLEEGAEVQIQKFSCENDAREDETIQSTIVKIIERANVNTVIEIEGVSSFK
ncbi:Uncharacterised protein [Zhongshania aliphaticivorans]|uniref:Uncharacterized protein n=1 Tax=Zhongshania aliphaticivorans TaxID=1470434 RepID=A0A5S9PND4_9GAMM|nr:hypothetical protein [Zhongshania aliphaticivorans]CAA0105333.1 Uncharacterised protein [Zhongshania aliphaticivorans]CAA0105643.1 Uncharacterised protein [Zhongshania aliphaticivorans]